MLPTTRLHRTKTPKPIKYYAWISLASITLCSIVLFVQFCFTPLGADEGISFVTTSAGLPLETSWSDHNRYSETMPAQSSLTGVSSSTIFSPSELYTLRGAFEYADLNKDGTVSWSEISAALKKAKISTTFSEQEWSSCLKDFAVKSGTRVQFHELVGLLEAHAKAHPGPSQQHEFGHVPQAFSSLTRYVHDEKFSKDHPYYSKLKMFVNGGLSGMTSAFILQPADTMKVQLQMGAPGPPLTLARSLGVSGLYAGVSAALLRQATYTTARLGIFQTLMANLTTEDGTGPSVATKAGCALLAGAVGALVGTPADCALVRMQADNRLPPAQRRNYRNVGDALRRTYREAGVRGVFAGCGPTVARAMSLNLGQLVCHDQSRVLLSRAGFEKSGNVNIWGSSFIAGMAGSLMSLPLDAVKTRLQQMKPDPLTRALPYKGFWDCGGQILRKEGALGFYKGLMPYLGRQLPHAILTFVFMSHLGNFQSRLEQRYEYESKHGRLTVG